MIKTILVLFIISLECSFINAQTYTDYYFHMHLASKYKEEKEYKQAALEYENAYVAAPNKYKFYVHASIQYFYVLNKLNNYSKIQDYSTELSRNYCKNTLVDELIYFRNYLIESNNDSTIDSVILIVKKTKFKDYLCDRKMINSNKLLDSILTLIHEDDQKYRRRNNRNVDSCMMMDAINAVRVYYVLKNYGMPTPENYRLKFGLYAAITHLDNLNNFNRISKFLYDAIMQGKYNPANFAYAYDRALIADSKLPIYYWGLKGFNDLKPKNQLEINQVNKNRKMIGLPNYPFWNGQNLD